ncbi:MAG TPA: hypothetical protein VM802_06865 [Chitinophaga sp.]|uniref:hypothetical protein n=1 Tax=Chitinophaga sp. TaxID=1869181 RepID=UPI002CEB7A88|nr:hypothetical protein [Chitinophaga sp.]HVI44571.1 hypothetical protein [Chitinophaga sp.]
MTVFFVPLQSILRNKRNPGQHDQINQISFQQYLVVTNKSNNYTFQRISYYPQYRLRSRITGKDLTFDYDRFTGYSVAEDAGGYHRISYFRIGNLVFDGGRRINNPVDIHKSFITPQAKAGPGFDTVDLGALNPNPGILPADPLASECFTRCVWFSTCGIGVWNVVTTISAPKEPCTEPRNIACDNDRSFVWLLNYTQKFNCIIPGKDPNTVPLPPGDGGGGGDGGTNSPKGGTRGTVTVQEISNQLKSPCLISGLHMALNNDLKDRLQDMICSMFSRNDKVSIQFTEAALLDKDGKPDYETDGDTQGSGSPNGEFKNLTVTLNTTALQNATLEYIVATIYHEAIHAYLHAIDFDRNLSQHNEMGFTYINRMSMAIKEAFPNISPEDSYALAWGGVHKSYSWIDILKNAPDAAKNILDINDLYKYRGGGGKGTLCK